MCVSVTYEIVTHFERARNDATLQRSGRVQPLHGERLSTSARERDVATAENEHTSRRLPRLPVGEDRGIVTFKYLSKTTFVT